MEDYTKTYLKLLERADQNRITDKSGNVFELDPENETITYISGPDIDTSIGKTIDTTNKNYEQTLINLLADTEPLKQKADGLYPQGAYSQGAPSVDQLVTEDARKSAAQQRALYASGVSAISAAGALPSLLTFIPGLKSEVEKQAEETIAAGVQEMTGAEEAQLKRMTDPRGGLREQRMRSEAGRATGLGSVLTSGGDATQAKTAEAEALASALQQQGMIIAQEKAKAIQQSLAEIRDAQMTDYAMARESKAAAQTMADSLGKALAFYGSYQMPQVDPDYAQALDDLGPNASPEQIKAHIKGQQSGIG